MRNNTDINVFEQQRVILDALSVELSRWILANIQYRILIQFPGLISIYRIVFDNKNSLDLLYSYSTGGNPRMRNKAKLVHVDKNELSNMESLAYRLAKSWSKFNDDCNMFI
jgi:hypothetical protein